MKTLSTPARCKKSLIGIKLGHTVPELAVKVGASTGTARRSINRLILRNEIGVMATRKCRKTGKMLTTYATPEMVERAGC